MDFLSSQQVSTDSLETVEYDLYIATSGYQKFCTFLPETKTISARRKIVLSANHKNSLTSKKNQRYFLNNDFELTEIPADRSDILMSLLNEILSSFNKKEINILIDYSCMPHNWLSAVINVIQESESQIDKIGIDFAYSARKYLEPPKSKSIRIHNPGFSIANISPSKPLALIIGLGLDKNKTSYVIKYLQPNRTIVMYADPAIDDDYTPKMFYHNEEIIQNLKPRDLINYPLKDANAINEIITQKCVELRLNYNIVIAPVGPRIFALNSYLLANRYPDIFVWNFGMESLEKKSRCVPSGDIITQRVTFVNEEEGY